MLRDSAILLDDTENGHWWKILPYFLKSFATKSIRNDCPPMAIYLHTSIVILFKPKKIRNFCSFALLCNNDTLIWKWICFIQPIIVFNQFYLHSPKDYEWFCCRRQEKIFAHCSWLNRRDMWSCIEFPDCMHTLYHLNWCRSAPKMRFFTQN